MKQAANNNKNHFSINSGRGTHPQASVLLTGLE